MIPLPEITSENFKSVWTPFEMVIASRERSNKKQAVIVPSFFLANLTSLIQPPGLVCMDMKQLKTALMTKQDLHKTP